MATYHCSIKHGKVGTGRAHSEYIRREGKYAHGEMKEELQYTECGNLPDWAEDPNEFFAQADLYERKNGSAYSEFEVALPNELSLDENIRLVQDFVQEYIGENKVYSFAIHDKDASLDASQRQPHAHIMFSERIITDREQMKPRELFFRRYNAKQPERGGYRKDDRLKGRNGQGRESINDIRAAWAAKINKVYESKGMELRVSEKTLKVQREEALAKGNEIKAEELDRPAQKHLGPKEAQKLKRALSSTDYKFEELSDRARKAMLACEIRKIAREIARYKEENKKTWELAKDTGNILKQIRTEARQDDEKVTLRGSQITSLLFKVSLKVSNKVNENKAKIEILQKMLLSEEKIGYIAVDIASKGASKRLRKEKAGIEQEGRQLDQAWKSFQEQPKPKFYELRYKSAYAKQKQGLLAREADLKGRREAFTAQQEALQKELGKEGHQKHIEAIKNVLRTKNMIKETNISILQKTNKRLLKLGYGCIREKNRVNDKITYNVEKSLIQDLKKFNLDKLQGTVDKIAKVISNARDEEVKGHMKVNLRVNLLDDDYER